MRTFRFEPSMHLGNTDTHTDPPIRRHNPERMMILKITTPTGAEQTIEADDCEIEVVGDSAKVTLRGRLGRDYAITMDEDGDLEVLDCGEKVYPSPDPVEVDVVFSGDGDDLVFCDVEDMYGESVTVGEWNYFGDGLKRLRIPTYPI